MNPFEAFTREFLAALAQPFAERDGRLVVALEGELAEHVGRSEWILTFKAHDEGELVAYGSRAFEAMQGFLATRGRLAACKLPESADTPPPLALNNGRAMPVAEAAAPRRYYVLNFLATFLSDERSETLLSYCLDEAGAERPEAAAWLEAAGGGEPMAAGSIPPRVAEAAEALALAEAERLALPVEADVLARLRRAADRLTGYYEEQIDEVAIKRRRGKSEDESLEEAIAERAFLRRELERKLAEEQGRYQLRVQVRPVSRAVVEVPGVERRFALETAHAQRHVDYWENRHTAVADYPACERCGAAEASVGLCVEGHLSCAGCLGLCRGCGEDRCASELGHCHHCGGTSCERCRGQCTGGHQVCREHLGSCGCCGQVFCAGCLGTCPGCPDGAPVAIAHAEPCSVCARPLCEAHRRGCGYCGKLVCEADAEACPGCGDAVCRDHFAACEHCELPYCARCRDEGASCRACAVVGQGPRAREDWLGAIAGAVEPGKYGRWTGIENERYRYMLGHGVLGDVLIVTDHRGTVVRVKEIGFWKRLFRYW